MPMRVNCKFFESRTYANGETVRKCDLDLAPEAPWRCPEDCKAFQPRLADVNWKHGDLIVPPTPPEPPGLGEDPSIAALLDSAEEIVNAVAPEVLADAQAAADKQARQDGSKVRRAGSNASDKFRGLFGRFRRK